MTAVTLATMGIGPGDSFCEGPNKEKYEKFKQFCETYGLNLENVCGVLSAWKVSFPLKSDNNNDSGVFICDYWANNYYHIVRGALSNYRIHCDAKKQTVLWPNLVSLDYSNSINADTFREFLSAEARAISEKEGADYFEVLERIKPELIRAILEYSAGERMGFAVYDGKRRYTLFEMFLTDAHFCSPNLADRVLGLNSDNWNAVFNSNLFTVHL